jgi:hypothetical protein
VEAYYERRAPEYNDWYDGAGRFERWFVAVLAG